ncbi:3,4-dihydroxy-2-butanone-4-phosphate synthase [Embleya sp. AB8]|uniref:3,4-dihydroxy-2-butanone-4-phosphate synthase n=1 Tax=Embleya sp. AB8 TaxID=3156304 RepID=UPI003C729E5A
MTKNDHGPDREPTGRSGDRTAVARLEQVAQAIETFARGGFVIVFDDESRENEGDLMVPAEHMTEEAMRFMLAHTAGVVCVAMPDEMVSRLELAPMAARNTGLHETAFTVSVDLVADATTGISAAERARTIRALADPSTVPGELGRPGHVFPIRAVPGGVLVRDGHTEAGVDLARLAGLSGATAMCEVVRPDWSMARLGDLAELAERHGLPLISVADLAGYRRAAEATPVVA